jgi:serine/threonine protein phosphatase 1
MKKYNENPTRRFAISDIHGCLKTFKKLVEEKIVLEKRDKLYLLGDYIDRGKDSKGVLDYIMDMTDEGYDVQALMGNHEQLFLKTTEDTAWYKKWKINGAEDTLSSMGIDVLNMPVEKAIGMIPAKYIKFIRQMKYHIILDDYWLVHGGFDFSVPDPLTDTDAMVWIRNFEVNRDIVKNAVVVHGHTPVPVEILMRKAKDKKAQVIDIDAGCVYTSRPRMGNLAALNLDNRQVVYVQNIENTNF